MMHSHQQRIISILLVLDVLLRFESISFIRDVFFFVPRVLSTIVNIYRVSSVLWEQYRVSQAERIARTGEKERKRNGTVPSLYCIRSPFFLVLPSSPWFYNRYPVQADTAFYSSRVGCLEGRPDDFIGCDIDALPTLDSSSSPRLFRSDGKGLQMAAISACIDSWNWEDLLVSAGLSHPHPAFISHMNKCQLVRLAYIYIIQRTMLLVKYTFFSKIRYIHANNYKINKLNEMRKNVKYFARGHILIYNCLKILLVYWF